MNCIFNNCYPSTPPTNKQTLSNEVGFEISLATQTSSSDWRRSTQGSTFYTNQSSPFEQEFLRSNSPLSKQNTQEKISDQEGVYKDEQIVQSPNNYFQNQFNINDCEPQIQYQYEYSKKSQQSSLQFSEHYSYSSTKMKNKNIYKKPILSPEQSMQRSRSDYQQKFTPTKNNHLKEDIKQSSQDSEEKHQFKERLHKLDLKILENIKDQSNYQMGNYQSIINNSSRRNYSSNNDFDQPSLSRKENETTQSFQSEEGNTINVPDYESILQLEINQSQNNNLQQLGISVQDLNRIVTFLNVELYYQIGEILNIGGEGIIINCVKKNANNDQEEEVAIKIQKIINTSSTQFRILNAINDSLNIIKIYEKHKLSVGDSFYLFYSMEKCKKNYKQYLQEDIKGCDVYLIFNHLIQLLNGLSELHYQQERIIHEDLKLTNIMINKDDLLVINDFGISDIDNNGCGRYPNGYTINNCPQEQQEEGGKVYHQSDIYSLGLIFIQLIDHNKAHQQNLSESEKKFLESIINIINLHMIPEKWVERSSCKTLIQLFVRLYYIFYEKQFDEAQKSYDDFYLFFNKNKMVYDQVQSLLLKKVSCVYIHRQYLETLNILSEFGLCLSDTILKYQISPVFKLNDKFQLFKQHCIILMKLEEYEMVLEKYHQFFQTYQKVNDNMTKIFILIQMARCQIKRKYKNLQEALQFIQQAQVMCQQTQGVDNYFSLECLYYIGKVKMAEKKYQSAQEYFSEILKVYQQKEIQQNSSLHFKTISIIGKCYYQMGDAKKALSFLVESEQKRKFFYDSSVKTVLSQARNSGIESQQLCHSYFPERSLQENQQQQANPLELRDRQSIIYSECSKVIFDEVCNSDQLQSNLSELNNRIYLSNIGEQPKITIQSMISSKSAQTAKDLHSNYPIQPYRLENIAHCLFLGGRIQESSKMYSEVIKIKKKNNSNSLSLSKTFYHQANCYKQLQLYPRAIEKAQQALRLFEQYKAEFYSHIFKVNVLIAVCYFEKKEYQNAQQYFEECVRIVNSYEVDSSDEYELYLFYARYLFIINEIFQSKQYFIKAIEVDKQNNQQLSRKSNIQFILAFIGLEKCEYLIQESKAKCKLNKERKINNLNLEFDIEHDVAITEEDLSLLEQKSQIYQQNACYYLNTANYLFALKYFNIALKNIDKQISVFSSSNSERVEEIMQSIQKQRSYVIYFSAICNVMMSNLLTAANTFKQLLNDLESYEFAEKKILQAQCQHGYRNCILFTLKKVKLG